MIKNNKIVTLRQDSSSIFTLSIIRRAYHLNGIFPWIGGSRTRYLTFLLEAAWHLVTDKWNGNFRKLRLNREKSNTSEGVIFFPEKFHGNKMNHLNSYRNYRFFHVTAPGLSNDRTIQPSPHECGKSRFDCNQKLSIQQQKWPNKHASPNHIKQNI